MEVWDEYHPPDVDEEGICERTNDHVDNCDEGCGHPHAEEEDEKTEPAEDD
jgi:hypothetical protein